MGHAPRRQPLHEAHAEHVRRDKGLAVLGANRSRATGGGAGGDLPCFRYDASRTLTPAIGHVAEINFDGDDFELGVSVTTHAGDVSDGDRAGERLDPGAGVWLVQIRAEFSPYGDQAYIVSKFTQAGAGYALGIDTVAGSAEYDEATLVSPVVVNAAGLMRRTSTHSRLSVEASVAGAGANDVTVNATVMGTRIRAVA